MDKNRLAKLNWQCRRGLLELDLFLAPMVQDKFQAFDETQLALFEKLLEHPDPDIIMWLMGADLPHDGVFLELIAFLQSYPRTPSI